MIPPIHHVQITRLTVVGDPELFNYGQMRDYCHAFTNEFTGGRVYSLVGECGTGGWALSYTLTGHLKFQSGDIIVNNEHATMSSLKTQGCYVGDDAHGKRWFRAMTVRQQILLGLQRQDRFSLQELVDWFELSASRLDRPMNLISNERWNASAAVGLAHGKFIFAFPWLNTPWINRLRQRICCCADVLRSQGAIVLVPTARADALAGIADETIFL